MLTLSEAIARIAAPTRRRDLALVAAFVATAGLAGQALLLAMWSGAAEPKTTHRLAGGVVETRELVLGPQQVALDETLRAFKPTRGWADEDRPPAIAVDGEVLAALFKETPHFELAAPPLPQPRPRVFAAQTPQRPAVRAREDRVRSGGFQLARLPTGADILRGLNNMGSSLGKLIRVSSR